jgi:acyl-CoA thioester hydrolase
MSHKSIWTSEVRDYEVDYQSIVNNANYFHYLDHARAKCLDSIGINVKELAGNDCNAVLIDTNISFKNPLTFGDIFLIVSILYRKTKFKFSFSQDIFLEKNNAIIAQSNSLICFINPHTKKPIIPPQLKFFDIFII